MTETQDTITEGRLSRPLFKLAWPIVITQLLQVAYNITDTILLGRVSAPAVGALSVALPVSILIISISGGFTVAGSTLVAQYIGAIGARLWFTRGTWKQAVISEPTPASGSSVED
ncbi:MatE protein [Haladaptatus litoreus]|uniref:MatE protein n=1 Tax=Haladaptatus litoreus TaxID=553468 RepID=A0A1N6UTK8_9EURY|nr:MATE family efflux transporter [Haladaptatus litoreus]SIQ68556.1 MatE protein [Haladaptatus litoreus]